MAPGSQTVFQSCRSDQYPVYSQRIPRVNVSLLVARNVSLMYAPA